MCELSIPMITTTTLIAYYCSWPYQNVTVFMTSFSVINNSSAAAEMRDPLATIDMGPKEGGCCAPYRRERKGVGAGPHLTQCGLGRDLPPHQAASWSNQPLGHNRHGPKSGGTDPFLGELVPHLIQCHLSRGLPPYRVASWSIQLSGHNRHGPKIGGCAPLGEVGPHLTERRLGCGLPPYRVASWSMQSFGHSKHGPKIWGLCPFLGRTAGSPSNTKSPGLKPSYTPSGILVHLAVWP